MQPKEKAVVEKLIDRIEDFHMYLMDYGVIDEDSLVATMETEKLLQAKRDVQGVLKSGDEEK